LSGKDFAKRHLSTDSFRTDNWILNIFDGWYDPCPFNSDYDPLIHIDGLVTRWNQNTFVNPPYSNPLPWVKKAIYENKKYGCTVAMLLKHDTSTKWYSLLHEAGAKILLVSGRLKHQTKTSCAFPSVIVILKRRDK
tara:strand:+ start:56 stop:463 length:408 start_codon:yes stop_codon:yes gene_type:complete